MTLAHTPTATSPRHQKVLLRRGLRPGVPTFRTTRTAGGTECSAGMAPTRALEESRELAHTTGASSLEARDKASGGDRGIARLLLGPTDSSLRLKALRAGVPPLAGNQGQGPGRPRQGGVLRGPWSPAAHPRCLHGHRQPPLGWAVSLWGPNRGHLLAGPPSLAMRYRPRIQRGLLHAASQAGRWLRPTR
jgi:hypothetical protein